MRKLQLMIGCVLIITFVLIAIAYYAWQAVYNTPLKKIDVLASDIRMLSEILTKFKEMNEDYPSSEQGLFSLDIDGILRDYIPSCSKFGASRSGY